MRRSPRLLILILFVLALSGGIFFAIKIAKGYRPSLANKALQGTGLLSANSTPKGASVFINDKLTTATDDTLNLPPGEYKIKIALDGYIPWEKTLRLTPELVTQTNVRLFPSVPNLKPLTFSGALNPTPAPDGQKIVFAVENATTESKNGLYVLDLQDRTFSFNSADPVQITRQSGKFDFNRARLIWSPDSSQILATLNSGQTDEINVLLNASGFNDVANMKDVTARLPVTYQEWQDLADKKIHEQLIALPEFMQTLATQSAKMVYFSPDDEMMMYAATAETTIPQELIPPLPASSTQTETRTLKPNQIYIYDLQEDKNFYLADAPQPSPKPKTTTIHEKLLELAAAYSPISSQPIQWYPDSRHILIVEDSKIVVSEYDATNQHVVYAGPFSAGFAYPSTNGSRLIILASLNGGTNLPPNLYSINLK
ncbi:MAG: PEGA domain-containing protein [Patescibacteria group bacterium]